MPEPNSLRGRNGAGFLYLQRCPFVGRYLVEIFHAEFAPGKKFAELKRLGEEIKAAGRALHPKRGHFASQPRRAEQLTGQREHGSELPQAETLV